MISTWAQFESEWTEAIVGSVNALRERNGLTVKQLASRLRDVGWSISDSTLAGIVSGKKRNSISVAELFAFARALNTSPTYLVLGLPATSALPAFDPLWGSESLSVVDAAAWIRGYEMRPVIGDGHPSWGAGGALDAVMFYSNQIRTVEWQAAQLVALERLTREEREVIAQTATTEADMKRWLTRAITRMVEAHIDQRGMGDWGAKLPPVPEPLVAAFEEDPESVVDGLSLDQIAMLTTPETVARASERMRERIREERRNSGQAPDPTR